MKDKVVEFPNKSRKRNPLKANEIEQIGFLTKNGRDLWIQNPDDIVKIMQFIVREKIQIYEDKKSP